MSAPLDRFEVQVHDHSDDPCLVCTRCGDDLCNVEHEDNLAVLVSMAEDHTCTEEAP